MQLQDTIAAWSKTAAPNSPCGLDAVTAAPHSSYIQQRLLQEFGNLEQVWTDSNKQTLLLELPLPAMQLLLSSDKLEVSQEQSLSQSYQACHSACSAHGPQTVVKQFTVGQAVFQNHKGLLG